MNYSKEQFIISTNQESQAALNMKFPKRLLLSKPYYLRDYFLLQKITDYTVMPYERFAEMRFHIESIRQKNIPGSIVELGCWKGGNASFIKKIAPEREVWAFDSFEGFPSFGENDKEAKKKYSIDVAVLEDAYAIAKKLQVDVHFVKGWFNETIPKVKNEIGAIAILRLDGDLYESTMDSLMLLYDQVSRGGVVLIDDYNFEGCRKAVYDFFCKQRIAPMLIKWGHHGTYYFIKV